MFPHQKRSPNFPPCVLTEKRAYESRDITAVISIRAHEKNPWVLDRLELLADFYQNSPIFMIVDFGSAPPYSERLREICGRNGFIYLPVNDSGVFSLSIARNEGAHAAQTDLLYFTDIDFFSSPGHYSDLARYANDHDFSVVRDIVLNLPAYHLTAESTDEFFQTPPQARHRFMEQIAVMATESTPLPVAEFIAPYSNNFLCTKDFFQIVGGYDSSFRGHGSEDFELMIRMAHHTRAAELPALLADDLYKPNSRAFFGPRPYTGFRRLGEAVSFRSESSGFKAFHLWHPCPEGDPWRAANDWSRDSLRASVSKYLETPEKLACIDHMPRLKTALCICKDAEHYGYFLPFRALGYRLELVTDDSEAQVKAARSLLADGKVDAFMIFNPYMKSHSAFHELFLFAKECGLEIIVAERGALPSTIYYAPDVSYNDPEFLNYDRVHIEIDEKALVAADKICDRIRSGAWTLENLTGYQETLTSRSTLPATGRLRVFIPLQLSDDMAVTKFVTPTQSYQDFSASICETARKHPDIVFVVKAHPLNLEPFSGSVPNVIVCANEENVHALIDLCDATLCYNSGVGLLSLIHGKPTVTIGNAFYNVASTGNRAASFQEAVEMLASGAFGPPSLDAVRKLIAWIVTKKYSFFTATDMIRSFKERKSHAYRDIMVTHLNWNGVSLPLGRASAVSSISKSSYVNGRLGLMIGIKASLIDTPPQHTRGPIKSFFINYAKKPWRRLISRLKSPI